MYNNNGFLLFSGESSGCYECDGHIGLDVGVYQNIEQVVNILHDMMEKKVVNDYPIRLLLIDYFDGEFLEDLDLTINAGCLSGLYEVNFKFNNIIYKVKRGSRKNSGKNG